MSFNPLCSAPLDTIEKKIGNISLSELSEKGVSDFISTSKKVQETLSSMPVEERLKAVDEMGRLWEKKASENQLAGLKSMLSKSTGYCERLIDMEFSLVPSMLNAESLRKNLESSFVNGIRGLEGYIEIESGEMIRYLPAGPVFIISSGNSLIPPLIPTTISLVTGNLTLLRPSLANYLGVVEIYRLLREITSPVAKLLSEALAVSYFTHDSPALKFILTKAPVGSINFWGGEPARTDVSRQVSENIHHPRLVINGPLTGYAIIDESSAEQYAAMGLAKNMILYDQQLCSSPTQAAFIGSWAKANEYAQNACAFLETMSADFPMKLGEGSIFALQSARRFLQFKGSSVYSSKDIANAWTIILSKGESVLDEVVAASPEFNLYNRRRFIEIVVVDTPEKAVEHLRETPSRKAFRGVDKVQTVGLAVSDQTKSMLLNPLANSGVYRVLPLGDMFMRSANEPYDGVSIAAGFTYMTYYREKTLLP